MVRPRKHRKIRSNPNVYYFKPQGIALKDLEEIILNLDEFEALHLKYEKKLDQTESAKRMGVSQSTLQRVLASALEKISKALLEAKAIRIELTNKNEINEDIDF